MLITRLDTSLVELPLPSPIGTSIHSMRSTGCVLLEIGTDDGLVGQSFLFTLNADRIRAFDEMVRGLSRYVIGRNAFETTAIWDDVWLAINPTGHKGVTIAALSAIDIACWDLVGRTLGQPLHRIFGACRDRVDTYASSGLWLSSSIDHIVAEAASFIEQGFTSIKMRIGSDNPTDDVTRVSAVRDTIGPHIGLLTDANQGLTTKQAIRLGRQLEPFNLTWIEEPVPAYDLVGHAEVRTALDTPIASGETEYTRFGMQAMIDARSADILMPDLQRIGGYTEFKRAAAAASAHNLPVSSHFFTEHSLAMAGSVTNCISVEHIDWFAPLFNEQIELVEGQLVVPDRPGTGFSFAPDLVERFPLDDGTA